MHDHTNQGQVNRFFNERNYVMSQKNSPKVKDQNIALIKAITENNINRAKKLLDDGANVNQMHDEVGTLLMYACAHNYSDIVSLLLNHNVEINTVVNGVVSALRIACASGNTKLVELLLKHGANANEKFPSYLPEYPDRFNTPLNDAIQINASEIVALLLSHGADINIKDHFSLTPLHNAALLGHSDIVHMLLKKGAAVNAITQFGETPLYHACFGGSGTPDENRILVVKELLEHRADPNIRGSNGLGESPLQNTYGKFFKKDDIAIIKLLLKNGAQVSQSDVEYFEEHQYQDLLDLITKK